MTAPGSSTTAGQKSEYVQPSQGQRFETDNDRPQDPTDTVTVVAGESATSFVLPRLLLIDSSIYFKLSLPPTKHQGETPHSLRIPSEFTTTAFKCFLEYLSSNDAIPSTAVFAKHGIEACNLNRLLGSSGFRSYCERGLQHAINSNAFKPSLSDLQCSIDCKLSKAIQDQMQDNIIDRILANTYEHTDDDASVAGSTWKTVNMATAKRASTFTRATVRPEPFVNACNSIAAKDDNTTNTAMNQRLYGGNKGPTSPIDLSDNKNIPNMNTSNTDWCHSYPNVEASASAQNPPQLSGGLFGQSSSNGGGLFGNNHNQNRAQSTGSGLFGQPTQNVGGLFGANQNRAQTANTSLFGQPSQSAGGLFGSSTQAQTAGRFDGPSLFGRPAQPSGGLFGSNYNPPSSSGSLFGNPTGNTNGGLFGKNRSQAEAPRGLFGNPASSGWSSNDNQNQNHTSGGLFGRGSLFGNTCQPQTHPPTSHFGCSAHTSPSGGNTNTPGFAGSHTGATGGFGNHANPYNGSTCFPTPVNNNTGSGFGRNNGFGFPPTDNSIGTGFGQNVPPRPSPFGTTQKTCTCEKKDNSPFSNILGIENNLTFVEKELNGTTCVYHNIFTTEPYSKVSPEELRLSDYNNGRHFGPPQAPWQHQTSVQAWGNPLKNAELDLLRVRVNKLEQDTSMMANKVYELEKGKSMLTEKAEKLEKEVEVLTNKVKELEATKTTTENGDNVHESATAYVETLIERHITVHTEMLKQYLNTTTDLIRADIKSMRSTVGEALTPDVRQKKLLLVDDPTKLVIREQVTKQKGKEPQIVNEESGNSTYSIIYTPTSSTFSSRESSPAEEITTTETEGFVAVEASPSTTEHDKASHPGEKRAVSPKDTMTTTLEDQVWSKIPTLSPEARKIFSSLWTDCSTDKSFDVVRERYLLPKFNDSHVFQAAINELVNAGVIHCDPDKQPEQPEASLFSMTPTKYSWGPKKT